MRVDYRTEHKQGALVKGIPCEFIDMRVARSTVPEGKFVYEVAGDDDSGGNPCRVKREILVNFFGTLICDQELPLGGDLVLWLDEGDFQWMD